MQDADLARLFTPIRVNGITLPNRFIMPAMQRGWCDDGIPFPQLADYYRRRVVGGASLIIGESAAIDHVSATAQKRACRLNEASASMWQSCVAAVHDAGGHMLLQLWHEGAFRFDDDGQTVSPSGLAHSGLARGRAATAEDLAGLIEGYVRSARLAQQLGADGVELHCAHGFLLDQFLWAETNRRDDGYGGPDIAARARFPAEIVAAIRAACGPNFVISLRFSQWKEADYDAKIAMTLDELATLTGIFRAAGVDMLHASTRRFWLPEWPGSERTLAGCTRDVAGLPVAAVGSVGLDRDVMASFASDEEAQPRVAETLARLKKGAAEQEFDLISVGRSLIGDPEFVNKVRDCRLAEIRPFQRSDIDEFEWEH